MSTRTAWMPFKNAETTQNDFVKVEIIDEGRDFRFVQIMEGAKKDQKVVLPAAGIPFQGFHPCLYEQKEKPQVFWYKGRSLQKIDVKTFKDPVAAALLVPDEEAYEFPPHTLEIIDGILSGDHEMLSGKKGVGKTSIILQIAARIGMPVIRINFTGHTSISDIVGSVGFGKDGTVFKYGPVIRAMMEGYWCLADEFDFGEPRVLSVFHSILERHPAYCLKENEGEVIVAKPSFRFFGTANTIVGGNSTKYVGTNKMNIALLDRFSGHGRIVHVKSMNAKQERRVISARMPNLPHSLIRRATEFAAEVRADPSQGQSTGAKLPEFSTRELLNWCQKMIEYKDPILAANLTFLPTLEAGLKLGIEKVIEAKMGRRVIIGRSLLPQSVRDAVGALALSKDSVKIKVPTVKSMKTPTAVPTGTTKKKGTTAPREANRTAAEVTDPVEMEKIYKMAKKYGGALSFEKIELEGNMGLRIANGMTALRVCKNYLELVAKAEGKPLPKQDDDNLVAGE